MFAFYNSVIREVVESLRRWPLWTALAWEDIHDRYRRTVLGILWVTLSFALFCGVKILIFGTLARASPDFFSAYVVVGFLCWQFISPVVTDGCNVFIVSRGLIRGASLPLPVFILQSITRVAILTAFNAVAGFLILLFIGWPRSPVALAAVAAIPIYLATATAVQLILGTATASLRDLAPVVSTVMRVMFFLTPIIWIPAELGSIGNIAWFNPITHYIEIVRAPIVYGEVPEASWIIVLCCTLAFWVVAIAIFGCFRRRIVYWL